MGGYIAAIWGWDEQVQRDFHTRAFNPARWQIITVGGADIGMLDVEYRPGEIYLPASNSTPIIKGMASAPAWSAHSSTMPCRKARTWS